MKGYKIEHREDCFGVKADFIEQCNFHVDKIIGFYGWTVDSVFKPIPQTVAIFKTKWKCDKPTLENTKEQP